MQRDCIRNTNKRKKIISQTCYIYFLKILTNSLVKEARRWRYRKDPSL
jgi:hypothetical protein